MILYDKMISKTDIVKQIAEELPIPPKAGYLLCDSWYTCVKVMDAFLAKGFYTVGTVRTNRIVYPYGIGMKIKELSQKLNEAACRKLFHIVTVKGRKYYVYRYEGSLKGIPDAVILLTYPVEAFGKEKSLRAFISIDVSLSDQEILERYVQRWKIEVFFRTIKNRLAFDHFQVRSVKAVHRLWDLLLLVYLLSCSASDAFDFLEGFTMLTYQIQEELYGLLYDAAVSDQSKSASLALAR